MNVKSESAIRGREGYEELYKMSMCGDEEGEGLQIRKYNL